MKESVHLFGCRRIKPWHKECLPVEVCVWKLGISCSHAKDHRTAEGREVGPVYVADPKADMIRA